MNRLRRAALLGLISLTWLFAEAAGAAEPAAEILLAPGAVSAKVDRGVELLVQAPGESLTAQQVMAPGQAARWKSHVGKTINMPMLEQPVWIRFTVTNGSAAAAHWVATIEWPLLREIDFHALSPASGRWDVSYSGGLSRAIATGQVQDPLPAFGFDLAPGERRVMLLRVRNAGQVSVPLMLWEREEFHAKRYRHAVFMGLLFGTLAAMLFYNLSLFVFTADRGYLWYCVYVASVVLYEAVVTGYGPYFIWPGSDWLRNHGFALFASFSFLSAAVFFRHFLKLHKGPRHLGVISLAPIVFWSVYGLLIAPYESATSSMVGGSAGLLTLLACIYISGYLAIKGEVLARYFLIAWSAIIVGTSITLMSQLGVVERGGWVSYAQQIAFAAETVLLSVALAERIKRERSQKYAAQRAALQLARKLQEEREQKISAQDHALALQREANEELERHVLDRTAELNRAMRNVELANVELSKLSVTDALTKVHNRRYFDETLEKEHARSARNGLPLALLLADIDYFKRVNDSLGHLAGDECLRLVGVALQGAVGRSTDLVARYGGEEFAVVLPGTGVEQALEVAERIRQAVQDIPFIYRGQRVPISISLGVVARVAVANQQVADFVAEADQALYAAKGGGRNQVRLAANG